MLDTERLVLLVLSTVVLVGSAGAGIPGRSRVGVLVVASFALLLLLAWARWVAQRGPHHGTRAHISGSDERARSDEVAFELGSDVVRLLRPSDPKRSDASEPTLVVNGRPASLVRRRLSRTEVHVDGQLLLVAQKMPFGMIRARAPSDPGSTWETGSLPWVVSRVTGVSPRAGLVLNSLAEAELL